MVTDIINRGRYSIRGSRVTVRMQGPAEIDGIRFRIDADGDALIEERSGSVWTRKPDRTTPC